MKSVSTAFLDKLKDPNAIVTKEISYKRRYWQQSTRSFIWEGDWTILPEKEVVRISPITGKLDTERLNEFKISNVTLLVKNNENQWKDSHSGGKFGPDSVSPTYPYIPYWTKFRVRTIVKLYDGTSESLTIFTGLATDYQTASDDQMQITIQGLESLLIKGKAENVSTRVVGENVGTANGVLTQFSTAFTGVGIIEEVSVGGLKQTAGTIYSISQLNELILGAKITFAAAPASGIVRVTYRYWKQDRTVEDLVADLATEAGIPGGSQDIDPVIFPSGVINALLVTSQSEWEDGTLTDLDSSSVPGSIFLNFNGQKTLLDDFSDFNMTANPVWTQYTNKLLQFDAVPGFIYMDQSPVVTNATMGAYTPSTKVIGTWQFKFGEGDSAGSWGAGSNAEFAFMASGASLATGPTNAYSVRGHQDAGQLKLQLIRRDAAGAVTVLSSVNVAFQFYFTYRTYKVVRNAAGEMRIYVDGVLYITYTDLTFTTSSYVAVHSFVNGSANHPGKKWDEIYIPSDVIDGEYISEAFDLTASVTTLGRLTFDEDLNGGEITWFTRTSTDGISWDAWVEIASNGQILSDVKRYLQVKAEISCDSDAQNNPIIDSWTLEYSTTVTAISLANFTGQTCYEAIQALGTFANYEWGFTASEDFFFRSKVVTKSESFILSRKTNLKNITGLTNGYDQVYTEVKATYGNFETIIKSPGDHVDDPSLRYGNQVLELSDGGILIAEDVNIAKGVAAVFFAAVSKPKKRLKAICKYLPHVDLSDIGLISYDAFPQKKLWWLGDKNVYLGQTDIYFMGPNAQLIGELTGFYGKVMGFRHDADMKFSELDFEEVL